MINKLKEGQSYTEEWMPTHKVLKQYCELSGDYNPIHTDLSAAKKIGKNNIIIHGNLTCSIISKIIGMNFPGKGSLILEQKVLFPNPIFPDDLIRFKFIVKEINTQLNTILISIKAHKVSEINKNTETVLRGNVLCLI